MKPGLAPDQSSAWTPTEDSTLLGLCPKGIKPENLKWLAVHRQIPARGENACRQRCIKHARPGGVENGNGRNRDSKMLLQQQMAAAAAARK